MTRSGLSGASSRQRQTLLQPQSLNIVATITAGVRVREDKMQRVPEQWMIRHSLSEATLGKARAGVDMEKTKASTDLKWEHGVPTKREFTLNAPFEGRADFYSRKW